MRTKPNVQELMNAGGSLMELARSSMSLASQIVESRGELTPEIEALLEVNKESIRRKLDGYVWVTDQSEIQANLWRRKAQACAAIAKGFERVGEKLNERIKFVMGEMELTEIEGSEYRYKLTKTKPALKITQDLLPSDWLMQVTENVPDKERIKVALEEGFEIPGCALEGGVALRTYENTGKKD